jgi:predicted esterase
LAVACAAGAGEPELRPGTETRVEAPRSGGHFVVYVPTDYRPSRRWPVIFCYHGLKGQPTTSPFRQVLQGRGFIIVGMEYLVRGKQRLTLSQMEAYMAREVSSFERVAAYVERRLRVDKTQLFCGGFSKGGWTTSGMGEATPRTWCGLAILGAARQYMDRPAGNPSALRGMPVFIGCGTKDPNFAAAQEAASFYRKHGAKVTFEPWEGLAHEMQWDTKALPEWLYANGPQRNLKGRLAAARKAEKAGRLGRAYTLYHELSQVPGASDLSRSAGEVAKRLAGRAERLLAEAEKAIGEKRYAAAPRLLAKVAGQFEGSAFGERADALIKKLQSDPTIQAELRQGRIDAAADELEARARSAEQAKDYAEALRLYGQYVAKYPSATRFKEVNAHLDSLKADKAIRAAALGEQAARECRVWLNLADNYARAGKAAKAREYLEKILAKYGGTDWAAKARERLAALDAAGD